MSFTTPTALLALIAVPVLLLWYLGTMTRNRNAAAAFSSPHLAASVTPSRPGWRKHGPALLLLLAVTVLLLAMAGPQRTKTITVEEAKVMLVTDVSGSMLSTDIKPTRLRAAKSAARRFLKEAPKELNIGIMVFNQIPRVLQSPTTDREALREAIGQYQAGGGTATGSAIIGALRSLNRSVSTTAGAQPPPATIVLLSDGVSTKGADPFEAARTARKLKTPVSTVALGTKEGTIKVPRPHGLPGFEIRKVPPDPAALKKIADLSGGRAFDAASYADISAVYKELGSQLGRRTERQDLTVWFAGLAALLTLAAITTSLRWFGRIA